MSRETLARDKGWVPKEEWVEGGNDADMWVDANEFLYRGELMDRISSQSSAIKGLNGKISQMAKKNEDLTKSLKALGEHNKKIAEAEYKKALRDLRKQASEATAEGDHDTAAHIEEQIDDLQNQAAELKDESIIDDKPVATAPYSDQDAEKALAEWAKDNQWYETSPALQGAADKIALTIDRSQLTPKEFLDEISRRVKEEFPERFKVTKKKPPAATEPGDEGASKNKSKDKNRYTVADLSAEQKMVMKTMIEAGAPINEQEFVNQLAEIGDLG